MSPRSALLSLAARSARRPGICLALLATVTLVLGAKVPSLELRTDGAALHPVGHPAVERTARDRELFGDGDEVVLLLAARPGGPAVDSVEGLETLAALDDQVAELPGVLPDGVRSAAGLVDVASSGIASLGHFFDRIPTDDPRRARQVERMRRQPWTDGLFLAADGRAAALYATLDPAADRQRTVEGITRWAADRPDSRFDLTVTGPAVAQALLGDRILDDLVRLVPLMVLVVAVLLFVTLRCAGGVLVPLTKSLAALVWTAGAAAWVGVPVTLVTTILPVLLLALAVTDEVHVLARFQSLQGRSDDPLGATLGELYRPVVHTSISTALGFLSFAGASILPLRHLGVLAAVGIVSAMVLTFTLTPALVAVLPGGWWGSVGRPRREALASRGAGFHRPTPAFAVGVLLVVGALPGVLRLTVQDSWIDNFDPEAPVARAVRELDGRFWGSYRVDVVLRGEPGRFHGADGVGLIGDAARVIREGPRVGGVVTPLDPLALVGEVLGLAGSPTGWPTDAFAAVVQVAEEFPRQLELHRWMTADGREARLTGVVAGPDTRSSAALVEHLDRELGALLAGTGVEHHTSGDVPVALATVEAAVGDQLRSVAWTLAGVGLLLLVANRRPGLAVIQLVPPAAAAWLVLGAMGWAGMPLGVATSLFTALTVGIGVDLALHVTYAFVDRRDRGMAVEEAIDAAFSRTATGRRWSTAILALGFLVLVTSDFGPNHDLGMLLAAAMVAAYLTTSLLVPWLLRRWSAAGRERAVAAVAAVAVVLVGSLVSPSGLGASGTPTPETVLRRAELVRNPPVGVALDMHLAVETRDGGYPLRESAFTLLTRRGGRTLMLMETEDPTAPGALLLADDSYRLLLPRAEEPVELPLRQVVAGDLSHAGVLRVELWRTWEVRSMVEGDLDGRAGWSLELVPRTRGGADVVPFARVRYQVERDGFLPRRIDFLRADGAPVKTVRFTEYRTTGFGRRPARLEIDDAGRPDERAILHLGPPVGVPTAGLAFDEADLLALRDAGRRLAAAGQDPTDGRRLVQFLRWAARGR